MKWNEEELEQWILANKQKEEDNLIIAKYSLIDKKLINDLTLQLEKATKELNLMKTQFDEEVLDVQSKVIEIERISQELNKSQLERKDLMNQLQDILQMIERRDVEINSIGEKFALAKSLRSNKEKLLKSYHEKISSQQKENREVDVKSQTLNRLIERKREEYKSFQFKVIQSKDELETLKSLLVNTSEKMLSLRLSNTNSNGFIEELKIRLDNERSKYQRVKQSNDKYLIENQQKEKSINELDQSNEQLIQRYDQLVQQVNNMKLDLVNTKQDFDNLLVRKQQMLKDMKSNNLVMKNLNSLMIGLDKESSKQMEVIYNIDYQIQQLERKIARGYGERTIEEKNELNQSINELEVRVEELKEKKKMLSSQLRKLINEFNISLNHYEEEKKKKGKLIEELNQQEVQVKMLQLEIARDIK